MKIILKGNIYNKVIYIYSKEIIWAEIISKEDM